MQALEKRQTQRIIRNVREAERDLFELIEELQLHSHDDTLPYDWDCALTHLDNAHYRVTFARTYVKNTVQELERLKGGVA